MPSGSARAGADTPALTDGTYPPAAGLPAQGRMIPPDELATGQTPFDALDRGELLRLVQGYHQAAMTARAVLQVLRHPHAEDGFWRQGGLGHEALTRNDVLVRLARDGNADDDASAIYHAFFRMAGGLLFPTAHGVYDRWGVNDAGEWRAPDPGPDRGFRPATWHDLIPKQEPAA